MSADPDDGAPVIGLPGCVMYAGATIFDLILPRVVAAVPVTKSDLPCRRFDDRDFGPDH